MGAWFGDSNGASGSGSDSGLGMVPGQVGRGKMKGKGAFGYGSEEVVEVDPVSVSTLSECPFYFARHLTSTTERDRLGQAYHSRDEHEAGKVVSQTDFGESCLPRSDPSRTKSSLTLAKEPSPADIRPLHILKETLQLLKRKWKDNHNYAYALDQFKSMRQDLTVSALFLSLVRNSNN